MAQLDQDRGDMGQPQASPVRARSPLPAFLFLGVGAAIAATYLFLPLEAQNIAQNIAGAAAVVAVLVGTRLHRPSKPSAWLFMALGLFLLLAGDTVWTYYEVVLNTEAPVPSVADAAYLAGYVPLAIGLVLIVRARHPGRDTGSLIDAAIVTAAFGVGAWIFLIEPAIEPGLSNAEIILSVAYPLVDVLLIAVIATLAFGTVMRAFSYRLITASLLSLIAADIMYSVSTIADQYSTGNPLDIGWIMSNVFWGSAALHPSMRKLTIEGSREPTRFTRRRLVVYTSAVLAVPAMRIILTVGGGTKQGTVIAAGAATMSLLVLARMAGLLTALESAALQDPLTGLPNRRLLLDRLSQAFKRAERSAAPVAVLFLDLGGFKHVNDRFGHEAGDEALVEIGRRIQSAVRASDTVARLGGDEFVIVCEGLSQKQAESLARRIRAGVASPLEIRGSFVELTVDLGIAVENAHPEGDVSNLLRMADRAMYTAKATAKAGDASRRSAEPRAEKEDAGR